MEHLLDAPKQRIDVPRIIEAGEFRTRIKSVLCRAGLDAMAFKRGGECIGAVREKGSDGRAAVVWLSRYPESRKSAEWEFLGSQLLSAISQRIQGAVDALRGLPAERSLQWHVERGGHFVFMEPETVGNQKFLEGVETPTLSATLTLLEHRTMETFPCHNSFIRGCFAAKVDATGESDSSVCDACLRMGRYEM